MKLKGMPKIRIKFQDENIIKKRISTLRVYNMSSVKDFYFKELEPKKIENDLYKLKLHTDKKFKLVYGQIYILCEIKDGICKVLDIEPKRFLEKGFASLLEIYKGIPIAEKSDLAKIKILEKMGRI